MATKPEKVFYTMLTVAAICIAISFSAMVDLWITRQANLYLIFVPLVVGFLFAIAMMFYQRKL